MTIPEVTVYRSRDISCPESKPRKLHQISHNASVVSSIETDEKHDTIMIPEHFLEYFFWGQPFRCHDCPQVSNMGCISTSIKYEEASLNPSPFPEVSLADSFPPVIAKENTTISEANQSTQIEAQKPPDPEPINTPILSIEEMKAEIAAYQQEITEYFKSHPEEANKPFNSKDFEGLDI